MDPSYNNSFGMPAQQPIVSPSNGGFLPAKKNKRWVVVLVVIIIFITLVSGVLFWFLSTRNKANSDDYRMSFYHYANYLISGSDSKNKVTEIDVAEDSYIDGHYKDGQYIDVLKNRYKAFVDLIPKDKVQLFVDADISFSSGEDALDFIKEYDGMKLIDMGALVEIYKSNGEESAIEYIDNFYKDSSSNNSFIKRAESEDVLFAKNMIKKIKAGYSYDVGYEDEEDVSITLENAIYVLKEQCNEIISVLENEL
ncbi:hypothetical protein IKG28_02845 [Candidatus Saccharibacteria bacterium]|nr:hypothetical protein [Candidatus Saccharibacteria bacterium]